MNPKIKVRMPKFTRKPQPRSYWVRELLLTILATSISIVLTFGTAYYLDHRQKMNSQRQMAMMIIHDIDMSIQQMEKVDSIIREFSDIQLQVVEGRFDKDINFANVILSLRDPISIEFPETTERIFTSNVDTWSTIGKVDFIDNVSHCYLVRSQFKKKVIEAFHKKLQPDDMELKARPLDDYLDVEADYFLAQTEFAINELKADNEINKQIMGISNKDLEEFVETQADYINARIDSLAQVDSVIADHFIQMDDRKAVARENFNKNRDKMYPKKDNGRNKDKK